jgi:ribosomal protein L11 methyltransferase
MDYIQLLFTLAGSEDYQQDLLIQELADVGFDSFEETDKGFKAFIVSSDFNEQVVLEVLKPFQEQFTLNYEVQDVPQQNWNAVWENNFDPINIDNQVYVRASFHPVQPGYRYQIVIDPKMAFGTGHHETTSLMMTWMLESDFKNARVLDMGSGTGILAILASKMGATQVLAIDYDPVCYESILENSTKNNAHNVHALCGSKDVIPVDTYDIILANINRNILIDQMDIYVKNLKIGGEIIFSGFYESPDLQMIIEECKKYNLSYLAHKKMNDWVAAKFILNS